MLWYQLWILALIQGLTEFLPISSSAHLILPAQLLNWPDQGLAFDVAVHIGTLIAVVAYFWKELMQMALSIRFSTPERWRSASAEDQFQLSMVAAIIVGTIPAGLIGFALNHWIEANLRSIIVIASATLFFGLLLGWADIKASNSPIEQQRQLRQLRLKDVLIIGCAQALALIPGTSRSGITLTAALGLGFSRQAAARFSFLLSIPLIAAAGLLKTFELFQQPQTVDWMSILCGVGISGISAWFCIRLFLGWIDRIGLLPFVVYRILLATVLLCVAFL